MTEFDLINEDFHSELAALNSLLILTNDYERGAKVRIVAANSISLLLAATFEEYIRSMAREISRVIVKKATNISELPPKFLKNAWDKTIDRIAKSKLDDKDFCLDLLNKNLKLKFDNVYDFCRGDLSKDIFDDLIHNKNNMRPQQFNELFSLSGLKDAIGMCCNRPELKKRYGQTKSAETATRLKSEMDNFFERRNLIAHALNAENSSGANQIETDIEMFRLISVSLCHVLNEKAGSR